MSIFNPSKCIFLVFNEHVAPHSHHPGTLVSCLMKCKHQTKHPQKIIWRPHVDIKILAGEHLSLVLPRSCLLLYSLLQLQYQLPKCNSGTARGPLGNCRAPPEKISPGSVSVLYITFRGVYFSPACVTSLVLTSCSVTTLQTSWL